MQRASVVGKGWGSCTSSELVGCQRCSSSSAKASVCDQAVPLGQRTYLRIRLRQRCTVLRAQGRWSKLERVAIAALSFPAQWAAASARRVSISLIVEA